MVGAMRRSLRMQGIAFEPAELRWVQDVFNLGALIDSLAEPGQ
jgi:hypothetical protein